MNVLDAFFGPGNDLRPDHLGTKAREQLDPWIQRWQESRGPAFLPRRKDHRLLWYGLLDDDLQRREVDQLLRYWVGPSCSDVSVRQGALDDSDPFDARLEQLLPRRIVRLEVWPTTPRTGPSEDSKQKVRARLEALVRMLDRRPQRRGAEEQPLPVLLDELDVAAMSGERDHALKLLEQLIDRQLLDAPNSTFAEIRVKALLGLHDEVLDPNLLGELHGLMVPPGIATHIARSAYEARLRAFDEAADPHSLLDQRHQLHAELAHAIRQAPLTDDRAVLVTCVAVLGHEPAIARRLTRALPDEPHLQTLLGDLLDLDTAKSSHEENSSAPSRAENVITELAALHHSCAHQALLDVAQQLSPLPREAHELIVLSAHELHTQAAARGAIDILERDVGVVTAINWPTRLIRQAVEDLVSLTEQTPSIDSWEAWFQAASSGQPDDPEAELRASDWQPLQGDRLLELIDSIDGTRLARMIGRLRASHEARLDIQARGALARRALLVLAISDRSDPNVRLAGRELIVDVCDSGLARDEVDDTLEIVKELLRTQLSLGTLSWAIDLLVEITGELAVNATEEIAALWTWFLEQLRPLASTISTSTWLQIRTICDPIGVKLPSDIAATHAKDTGDDPLACFNGRSILLYSLRERSARQAAARLRSVGAEVELSSAHVGSPRLAAQVSGVDHIVIVTAAAKHAATGFIEDAGRSEPIRVNSAGMSAILTVLEELCTASR